MHAGKGSLPQQRLHVQDRCFILSLTIFEFKNYGSLGINHRSKKFSFDEKFFLKFTSLNWTEKGWPVCQLIVEDKEQSLKAFNTKCKLQNLNFVHIFIDIESDPGVTIPSKIKTQLDSWPGVGTLKKRQVTCPSLFQIFIFYFQTSHTLTAVRLPEFNLCSNNSQPSPTYKQTQILCCTAPYPIIISYAVHWVMPLVKFHVIISHKAYGINIQ